jgi:N utilization substance protein A
MVVSELRGEKIDIIPWNNEPARFIAKALSPARVREVFVDDETKEATVVVPDDQLALAIGKEGLNARLAARLSGWRIDIVSDTEFAQQEADAAYGGGGEDEEYSGRCAAVLANGKRCPNAALPGSRYCGVPSHQALAEAEARGEVPVETPAGTADDPEVAELPPVAAAADEPVAPERPPTPEHTGPLGDAEEAAAAQATQTQRTQTQPTVPAEDELAG